jgi:hypothetical protein
MRYGIIIGIIVGLIGCGDVEPIADGGGAGAAAGAAGCGDVEPIADGGGAGAAAGAAGGGTGGGTGGSACVPDACNTCVNGTKTPVKDGTVCAAPWCGGSATSPFGGVYPTTTYTPTCQAGACLTVQMVCDAQSCTCGAVGVGYAGCFTDTGAATCKCVNANGNYCPNG